MVQNGVFQRSAPALLFYPYKTAYLSNPGYPAASLIHYVLPLILHYPASGCARFISRSIPIQNRCSVKES